MTDRQSRGTETPPPLQSGQLHQSAENFPSLASSEDSLSLPGQLSSVSSGEGVSTLTLTPGDDHPVFVRDGDCERFMCPVHGGVLHDTQQTTCGHRMCKQCVRRHLGGESSKRCPMGEDDCEDVTNTNTKPDKSFQREMRQAPVFCRNKKEGCTETMPYKNYRKHLEEHCTKQPVSCSYSSKGCKEKVPRDQLKKHGDLCSYRPVNCRLCHKEVCRSHLKNHDENECEEKVTGCPFGCGNKTLKRKEVLGHRDVCSMHPVDCKFKKFGCTFVARQEEMERHVREGLPHHLHLVATRLGETQQQVQARQQAYAAEREEWQHSVQTMGQQRDMTTAKIIDLDKQVKDIKLKLVTALEKTITLERKVSTMAEKSRVEAMEQSVTAMQQRVTELERQTTTARHVGSSATGGAVGGGDTQVARYGTVHNMAETVHTYLEAHGQQLQRHDVQMAEMDLRFQLLECGSYDGTLIWKICDYTQRKTDAVNRRTLSLYSQPFYTHRFGYKMCGRVYLNGDGQGRTTHLSLFFAIMRGGYDALLKWPFRQKVTLTLLDQSPERRHLSDSFVPDINSSSFQKPTAEMNVATGCPLFVTHGTLEDPTKNYLKDDAIFIRITVDKEPYPYLF